MRPLLLVAVALFAGCPTEPSPYVEPPDSPLDIGLFPALAGSSRLFADVASARLEFDPSTKDAIVALGQCVDAATYCYAPGTKELSWCLENTRTCSTNTPWTEAKSCCPRQCKIDFADKVKAGMKPADALEQVFFVEKDCFPGVVEALEAAP